MSAPGGVRIYCGFTIFFVLLAYLYNRNSVDDDLTERVNLMLNALLKVEKKLPYKLNIKPRVAVGFGACNDLFVDKGVELLAKINESHTDVPKHFKSIRNAEQLMKTFSLFFRRGAAAERFMSNGTLFRNLVALAEKMKGSHWVIGGNAPVMASRFIQEGCDVLLGGKLSSHLLDELDPSMKVAGGFLEEDDIHLILEYTIGDKWGQHRAPRANRFIVHHDMNNPKMNSIPDFANQLPSFHPNLLVIGGLQMMDNFPFKPGERKQILQRIRDLILQLPCNARIHFEMASFSDQSFLTDLVEFILPYVDSVGMNEQELPNLFHILHGGNVTLISDPYPRVATVLDQTRAIFSFLNTSQNKRGCSQQTRIHVHTLAYQVIMTSDSSLWKNNMAAAAKASLTANRHVCGSTQIHLSKSKIILDDSFQSSREEGSPRMTINDKKPVTCWKEDGAEICIAPVIVCTEVFQTAGGGDNISSAALAYQI